MGEFIAATIRLVVLTVMLVLSMAMRLISLGARSAFRLFTNPIGWALLAAVATGIALIATQTALALGIVIVCVSGGVAIALSLMADIRDYRLRVEWLQSSLAGHPDGPAVAAQWRRIAAPQALQRPRPAQTPNR